MAIKKAIWTLTLIFVLSSIGVFALTINDVIVNPNSIISGSKVRFCADVTNDDISGQAVAIVTYPNGNQQKFEMKQAVLSKEVNPTCFNSKESAGTLKAIVGNYEYDYYFDDTLLDGTYSMMIVAFNSKSSIESKLVEFAVNKPVVQPVVVDYVSRVGIIDKVASVDNCKSVDVVKRLDEPKMTIHGTEYSVGQDVKAWLQLLYSNNSPISDAVCYLHIYSPNNDIVYIDSSLMTNLMHEGMYVYDLKAPNMAGVYPVLAQCYFTIITKNNFATDYAILNGTNDTGTLARTYVQDASYLQTSEASVGGVKRINDIFNFTSSNICTNISEDLLNSIGINWIGRWNGDQLNDRIKISVWNYTSGNWIVLPNTITPDGLTVQTVTNSMIINNVTKSGIVNGNGGNIKVRFEDSLNADTVTNRLDVDFLLVTCNQFGNSEWQTIRGSSEMHITSTFPYTYNIDNINLSNTDSFSGDSYYTGFFGAGFTVNSVATMNMSNELIEVIPFHSIDTGTYTHLYRLESNGSYAEINFTTQWHSQEGHSSIHFYQDLIPFGVTQYHVTTRNTWLSEIYTNIGGKQILYPLITTGCELYRTSKNYPSVSIPLQNSTFIGLNDELYSGCNYYLNTYYWMNQSLIKLINDNGLIKDENSFMQFEGDIISTMYLEREVTTIQDALLQNLLISSAYSNILLLNPLNYSTLFASQFWANISNTELNNKILSSMNITSGGIVVDSSKIWNFENRTLTQNITATISGNISVTANVNNTAIAENVWGWEGSIADNILTKIAEKIWQFVGGVAQIIT